MAVEGQTIPPGSSPSAMSAQTVTIALDDYHRFRGLETKLGEIQAKQAEEIKAKEQERLNALAESGQHKKALDETRTAYDKQLAESNGRYAQLEQQVYSEKTQTVIAQALTGRQFNAKTPQAQAAIASQIFAGLSPQFETSRSADGSYQTRHKVTGRPAADVLNEVLNSEEYAHFFVTNNRGGAGSDATRSPGNPVKADGFQAIKADFIARQQQLGQFGMGLGGLAGARK